MKTKLLLLLLSSIVFIIILCGVGFLIEKDTYPSEIPTECQQNNNDSVYNWLEFK